MEDDELSRLIAVQERIQLRRVLGGVEKEIWVTAARRIFSAGEREPCWVCGRFRSIAQAHHVVPLSSQYDRGFEVPDQAYVWLCPNHHIITHGFIQDDDRSMQVDAVRARSRRLAPIHGDLSEDEFEKILQLMHWASRGAA